MIFKSFLVYSIIIKLFATILLYMNNKFPFVSNVIYCFIQMIDLMISRLYVYSFLSHPQNKQQAQYLSHTRNLAKEFALFVVANANESLNLHSLFDWRTKHFKQPNQVNYQNDYSLLLALFFLHKT